MVYIHAPGGTGKTKLAALVARKHAEHTGARLLWFDLQGDPSFSEVTDRWMAGFGEDPPGEVSFATRIGLLLRSMWDEPALICLDNFET